MLPSARLAEAVAKSRSGPLADVGFDLLPRSVRAANLLAESTDRQDALKNLDPLLQSALLLGEPGHHHGQADEDHESDGRPRRHDLRLHVKHDRQAAPDQSDRKSDPGTATEIPGPEAHGDYEHDREQEEWPGGEVEAENPDRSESQHAPPTASRHSATPSTNGKEVCYQFRAVSLAMLAGTGQAEQAA